MDTVRKTRNPWIICFIVSLFYFFEFIKMSMLNSISTQLMSSFDVRAFRLAGLSAAYFYANVIFLIPAGLLLDRFSVKKIFILMLSFSILWTLVFSVAPTYQIALISRFLSGIGGAFVFIGSIRLITRIIPSNRISLAIGLLTTLGFLGGIVGQTPIAFLSSLVGWRWAIRVIAILGIFILCLIATVAPSLSKKNFTDSLKKERVVVSLKKVILNLQTWLGGLFTTFMNLPIIVLAVLWSGLYLQQAYHLSALQASFVSSSLFMGTLIGSPCAGWVSDYLQKRKPPMIIGSLFSIITLLCIMLIHINSLIFLSVLFLLLGFFSSVQCIGYPVAIENNPFKLTGLVSSIASILVLGVGTSMKISFGHILNHYWDGKLINGVPIYSSYAFTIGMGMILVAFILAFLFAISAKETYAKQKLD